MGINYLVASILSIKMAKDAKCIKSAINWNIFIFSRFDNFLFVKLVPGQRNDYLYHIRIEGFCMANRHIIGPIHPCKRGDSISQTPGHPSSTLPFHLGFQTFSWNSGMDEFSLLSYL
jgi:hypothetical protein